MRKQGMEGVTYAGKLGVTRPLQLSSADSISAQTFVVSWAFIEHSVCYTGFSGFFKLIRSFFFLQQREAEYSKCRECFFAWSFHFLRPEVQVKLGYLGWPWQKLCRGRDSVLDNGSDLFHCVVYLAFLFVEYSNSSLIHVKTKARSLIVRCLPSMENVNNITMDASWNVPDWTSSCCPRSRNVYCCWSVSTTETPSVCPPQRPHRRRIWSRGCRRLATAGSGDPFFVMAGLSVHWSASWRLPYWYTSQDISAYLWVLMVHRVASRPQKTLVSARNYLRSEMSFPHPGLCLIWRFW